jgi:hypothetical protein
MAGNEPAPSVTASAGPRGLSEQAEHATAIPGLGSCGMRVCHLNPCPSEGVRKDFAMQTTNAPGYRGQIKAAMVTMKTTRTGRGTTAKNKFRTKRQPGDIVAYHRRPRKGEILAHNRVLHCSDTTYGERGFRWFAVDGRPGHGWKLCPCGWRPDLGVHYAQAKQVKFWRDIRKKLGSQEAVDRYQAGRYPLLGLDLHRLDRTSFAAGALTRSPRRRAAGTTQGS